MGKPTYQVEIDGENSFSFLSVGKKGIILKVVELAEIKEDTYNLGFGDYDFANDSVDDKSDSENGDAEKVLATVFGILMRFLSENPKKSVYISGSTPIRIRFYRMIVNSYFDEFSQSLEILGGINEEFEPFEKDKPYESYLVKKLL
jgi:hypothetical protein